MKKIYSLLLLLSFVHLAFAQSKDIITKPVPSRLIVDNANILSPDQIAILEQKLVALDDSSGNQIVVITVPTLNDEPIENVATATFRNWGIGNKKTNNGVLLLIALNDKKIRIEVGYGLEGAITDILSNDIINNSLKPNFREKNYYRGINDAIDNLSKAAVGEYKVKREKNKSSKSSGGGGWIFLIILIIVIALVSGGRGRGGRGGGGNGFGGIMGPLLLSSLLNSSGRGGGGGFGGGGFGGGGDSGGGFGGFGGGSSGGGGASGDW